MSKSVVAFLEREAEKTAKRREAAWKRYEREWGGVWEGPSYDRLNLIENEQDHLRRLIRRAKETHK